MKTTNARKVARLNATQIAVFAARINTVLRELDEQNGTITYGALVQRIGLSDQWNGIARLQINALLDAAAAISTLSCVDGDVTHESFKRIVSATSGAPGTGINVRCRIVLECDDAQRDDDTGLEAA